jgi:Ribbon-helix-helix protein, copG family
MRTRDLRVMSTTVTLADDVAAAIEKLRRERSIGTSEAINELVRAGLSAEHGKTLFRQKTHDLGRGIDFTNVADAIETLDGSNAR